jgi:hypothetical protein
MIGHLSDCRFRRAVDVLHVWFPSHLKDQYVTACGVAAFRKEIGWHLRSYDDPREYQEILEGNNIRMHRMCRSCRKWWAKNKAEYTVAKALE